MASMKDYISFINISGQETVTYRLRNQPDNGLAIHLTYTINGSSGSQNFTFGTASSSNTVTYDGNRTFTFSANNKNFIGKSITYSGTVESYVINSDKTKIKLADGIKTEEAELGSDTTIAAGTTELLWFETPDDVIGIKGISIIYDGVSDTGSPLLLGFYPGSQNGSNGIWVNVYNPDNSQHTISEASYITVTYA